MKKLMITAAALMMACAAYGQGQFLFNTHDVTAGNVLTFTIDGNPATGADLFLEVSAGPDAQHLTALTPLLPINRTGAAAGYSNPFSQIYTVAGMGAGASATVGYEAYKGASSGAATYTTGMQLATSAVLLTEPPSPPNEVALGTHDLTIAVIPEPTTLALGLLGLGSLLAIRRRK